MQLVCSWCGAGVEYLCSRCAVGEQLVSAGVRYLYRYVLVRGVKWSMKRRTKVKSCGGCEIMER